MTEPRTLPAQQRGRCRVCGGTARLDSAGRVGAHPPELPRLSRPLGGDLLAPELPNVCGGVGYLPADG